MTLFSYRARRTTTVDPECPPNRPGGAAIFAFDSSLDSKTSTASRIYADLRKLPRMLIQVGSAETLLDDAVRLAGVAGAASVRVTLQIWPDMIHARHLFYSQLADARRALAEVGAFVRTELD